MKTSFRSVLVLVPVLAAACGAPPEETQEAPPVDLEAAQAAATDAVNQFEVLWEEEDMTLAAQLFAQDPDMVLFGTDAAERWVGYEALEESLEEQFDSFEDVEANVRDQVVTVHSSGEVAWFSQIMDLELTAGGESMDMEGLRFTGVLEKRDGEWRIVQIHASSPVEGQLMEY